MPTYKRVWSFDDTEETKEELEKLRSPIVSQSTVEHILNACNDVVYEVLSNPAVSRQTAAMSDVGREVIAGCIKNRLRIMLEANRFGEN